MDHFADSGGAYYITLDQISSILINFDITTDDASNTDSWSRAIRSKLSGNYAFPQNFHTRKIGEILVFYAMNVAANDSVGHDVAADDAVGLAVRADGANNAN